MIDDLIADLEDRILKYLGEQETHGATARALVEAIRQQRAFLSTEPIVTAIWDLNARSMIRVDSDWNVTLLDGGSMHCVCRQCGAEHSAWPAPALPRHQAMSPDLQAAIKAWPAHGDDPQDHALDGPPIEPRVK